MGYFVRRLWTENESLMDAFYGLREYVEETVPEKHREKLNGFLSTIADYLDTTNAED